MKFGAQELISSVAAGVLSLLWWDIRSIRKVGSIEQKERNVQREGDIDSFHTVFMKKEEHVVLCQLSSAQFENTMKTMLSEFAKELKEEIRRGNGG